MSDAFTYNGLGAGTPKKNDRSLDKDGNNEALFKQRASADYYKMDHL